MVNAYEKLMRETLKVSDESIDSGNSPFAALVVDNAGKIISKGHNCVVTDSDPTQHAEMVAIRRACNKLGYHNSKDNKRVIFLDKYTLVTTNEPCPMCNSAVRWSGIKRIVYGQPVEFAVKYGFNEDIKDKRTNKGVEVISGVLMDEIKERFDRWFANPKHVIY